MKELWKPIEGTNGKYEVSNTGKVRSLNYRHRQETQLLTIHLNHKGYPIVGMRVDGKPTTKSVHRLVANAFIPNPENKPQVNHINGIKTDNRVENLEWCTGAENARHAIDNGLWSNNIENLKKRNSETKREIVVINVTTREIKHFGSISDARAELGGGGIKAVVRGEAIQSHGHIAYYREEYEKLSADQLEKDIQKGLRSLSSFGDREKRPIIATNIKTMEKTRFESITDAIKVTKSTHISEVLRGLRKTSKGYIFEYADKVVMP